MLLMSQTEQRRARVLLAATDLNAQARVEGAARHLGMSVKAVSLDRLEQELARQRPDVLIVDLDEGREPALEALARARRDGIAPDEVIGFFSHVDDALRRLATSAGVRAIRRGEFWSQLGDLLKAD
jgi:CheY-like chemotaxis protein